MRTSTKLASSSEPPTADDFRAIHSIGERPAPREDIVGQPPRIARTSYPRHRARISTHFVLLALAPTVLVGLLFIIAFASIK